MIDARVRGAMVARKTAGAAVFSATPRCVAAVGSRSWIGGWRGVRDIDAPTGERYDTRSAAPLAPAFSAQCAQQNIRPPASTPWPMILHPQCSHAGAMA